MIVKADGTNKEDIEALSGLHSYLLPESAVLKLGPYFIARFYYSVLVKKGLIDAYLYKHSDKYSGFIACTDYPFDLMKLGSKGSFYRLLRVLFISILSNPMRLFVLFKIVKDKFPSEARSKLENAGQFMSFGVLEEYRKNTDENTGKTVTQSLMDQVFEHFRERGKKSFFLLVLESNERAINFYKKYNCEILNEKAGNSLIVRFETGL